MWIFINGLSPTFHLMLHGKFVISAGSTRLRLSGFHSRAIERALAQLADLYVQKGHDLHSCRQALRKSWRSELPPPKGFLHPPLKRVRRLRPSVCVSTPVSKDFHFPFTTISIFVRLDFTTLYFMAAGALSTPWQTQCNEVMPWSGKHGLITRVYLRQFFGRLFTFDPCSNLRFIRPSTSCRFASQGLQCIG